MPFETGLTEDWSAGTTIVSDEFWQCLSGSVAVTADAAPPAGTGGVTLDQGIGIQFSSGDTVRARLISGKAELWRESR